MTSRFHDPRATRIEAYRRGIVVLFAAGNDGPAEDTLSTHASDPWVIAVGSGTKSGDLSDFFRDLISQSQV